MKATTDIPLEPGKIVAVKLLVPPEPLEKQVEQLWTAITQLQLEVAAMKRTLREWQGD